MASETRAQEVAALADLAREPGHRTALALFHAGAFFEAHETWEELWLRERRHARAHAPAGTRPAASPTERLLHGLIKLAAAGVKLHAAKARAREHHARAALQLFATLAPEAWARAGLDAARVCGAAEALAAGVVARLDD